MSGANLHTAFALDLRTGEKQYLPRQGCAEQVRGAGRGCGLSFSIDLTGLSDAHIAGEAECVCEGVSRRD
jgi:hypothetical protein